MASSHSGAAVSSSRVTPVARRHSTAGRTAVRHRLMQNPSRALPPTPASSGPPKRNLTARAAAGNDSGGSFLSFLGLGRSKAPPTSSPAGSTTAPPPDEGDPRWVEAGLLDDQEIILMETTDTEGNSAAIVYRTGCPVNPVALEMLCEKVGWPARPIDKVEAALKNSFLVASLYLVTRKGGDVKEDLIGLSRCTSDHAFNATIWDVLVDPEYQGQGLGKAMVTQVVRSLLRRDIGNISLFADSKVVDFYTSLGFVSEPEGIKGMFWYPRF